MVGKIRAAVGLALPGGLLRLVTKSGAQGGREAAMAKAVDMPELFDALDALGEAPSVAKGMKALGMKRVTDWHWKAATIANTSSAFTHPMLRPIFFIPGLKTQMFYDERNFPWAGALKKHTAAIKAELLASARGGKGFNQYLVPEAGGMANFENWRTMMFVTPMGAKIQENIDKCPRTWAALNEVPGFCPENMTMFSSIDPGGEIKPHVGLSNLVLRVHLPLFVPEPSKSVIRSGEKVRTWNEGELLIFSDAYDHQVWNFGTATRAVLFFDIWVRCSTPRVARPGTRRLTRALLSQDPSLTEEDLRILKPRWAKINEVYGPVANAYEKKAKKAMEQEKGGEWFVEVKKSAEPPSGSA